MPVKKNQSSRTKKVSRKHKGGQVVVPQQQIAVAQPVVVPKAQLSSFPKKIRINVSSDLKSTIEAPNEAEYILAERMNANAKYGNPDVYIAQFGNDEETGSPIDIYTEYVYERLKDLGRSECQLMKHRGDAQVEGGFFSSASTRRQNCAKSVQDLKRKDNEILQSWVDNIQQNGAQFLENVQNEIGNLDQKIKDLETSLKDNEMELTDSTETLNDNIKGIDRETQQRLQEITRIIQDKEEDMSSKIDNEITDLQSYIKNETSVIQEIEKLDKESENIKNQIEDTIKQKQRIENGLVKVNAQLTEQGIDLGNLLQQIERSIAMYALVGGRRKKKTTTKKSRKKSIGGAKVKKTKKPSCKASVSKKIKTNLKEQKKGVFKSRKQAIAVAYSIVKKERPGCKRVLKQKSKK